MGDSIWSGMKELRLICDREIAIQQQRIETATQSFRKSLVSIKANAQENVAHQEKIGKLKSQLRDAEDDLVKALAVKTRKEAMKMATVDSIAATKAKIEELERFNVDQRSRKDEYASIISHQFEILEELEEKYDQDNGRKGEIEEAISWYNRILGFRIECGRGVKFLFNNINPRNPKEEYSFTLRHENDTYTLLHCDPQMTTMKDLIQDLNVSNGLFKFVRIMRSKFLEAATSGNFPQAASLCQDSSVVSLSAPVSSFSTDSGSQSPGNQIEIKPGEKGRFQKKGINNRGGNSAILSPGSALSLRRSPRFKVKK